jgi:serine/threonine-protein kinase
MNLVGTTLGQFQVIEELGRGGMATVYKAFQPALGRYVALKVLLPHLAQDEKLVQRFLREARAAAALRHPHVITIYDIGSENDIHYIVTEYLEGITLAQLLEQKGALGSDRVLNIVQQIAEALDHAHHRGYVHRDIKPSNIMIDPARNDHVTLMDFGLVRVVGGSQLTLSGTIVGTPDYMSPEQAKGEELDQRSDIYSLGVTVYHMLTGCVPFGKPTPHAVMLAHVIEEPPSMTSLGQQTPLEVEAVVIKSMAKEPPDRYQWAGEMARDLENAITSTRLDAIEPLAEPIATVPERAPKVPPTTPHIDAPARPQHTPRREPEPDSRRTPERAPKRTPQVARQPAQRPGQRPPRAQPATPPPPAQKKPVGRNKWLWPVVGVAGVGLLVALIVVCVVGGPVLRQLAQQAPTSTATLTPTAMLVPPTNTPIPSPTWTPVPPTNTPIPSPTHTPRPSLTATRIPPTATANATSPLPLDLPRLRDPVYEEDFASPGPEWEVNIGENAEFRIAQGAYSIRVTKTNWLAWNTVGLDLTDFEVAFEVRLAEGVTDNDAGMLFRYQDRDNYYELDISGENSFRVGKQVSGDWQQLLDWTKSSAIRPLGAVNRVRLIAEGDQFRIVINDELVGRFSDSSFASGDLAPVVTAYDEPPARAVFDNIRVWERMPPR